MNKIDEAVMIRQLRLSVALDEYNNKSEEKRREARKKRLALTTRLGYLVCSMTDDEWLEYRFITGQ